MNSTLGTRIAQLRKARGFTQEELADKLGLSAQAVSKWENDVSCPDISILPTLARLLDTTVDELLTGKSDLVQYIPAEHRKPLEQLTLRIRINSAEGDKVRVNLPMPLVKVGLEMGVDITPSVGGVDGQALKNIDLAKIMDMAERGMIGKIVEVESAEGDTIEVVVE